MSDISSLFKSIALPVMPEVGLALINTLDDDDAPVSKIHALIAVDPTLTAKLLGLANSAAFGLPRKVSTLDAALSLVGLSKVRALALSACLHNAFSMPQGIEGGNFWRYAVRSAGYAQWLAEGVGEDRQRAWLTGLMLRLGELIIGGALPAAVAAIEQQPCAPGERWKREHAACGFDEGEVTAELARRWNFPGTIVRALALATDPLSTKPLLPLAGVLHLAGRLADLPAADAGAIDSLPVPVMSALDLKYGWMKAEFPDSNTFLSLS
jgi:HD-like signal output (HDOD) protein